MSEGFRDLWRDLSVVALDRKLSDHCPILLQDKLVDFGPKPFRAFDVWFEDTEAEEVVRRGWNKTFRSVVPDKVFRDKLKNVKEELKAWSKDKFEKIDKEVDSLRLEASR